MSEKLYFWAFHPDYWIKKLESNIYGLSAEQAKIILAQQPARRGLKRWQKDVLLFLRQFRNPLMLLLIIAVVLSAFLGAHADVIIIAFILTMAGSLSFFRERHADRVLEKLKAMVAITSTVLRQGVPEEVLTHHIVPGDVLVFNAGDIVPADCIIMESTDLHVNEAALTGESFPVHKKTGLKPKNTPLPKRFNCLWNGTNIISGTAKALAINTGSQSLYGQIIKSSSTLNPTAFEKGLSDFGFYLMRITFFLATFILLINLIHQEDVVSSVLFALALAVGMAPELLPAITTVAMSSAAKRLMNKKVMVKRLSSIQNLGEVNLLCTDKTGTVTEGDIQVRAMVDYQGKPSELVKTLAYWNACFETGYNNPIDEAIKKMGAPSGNKPEKTGEIPFDFVRKRLSVGWRDGKTHTLASKGAFKQIISTCRYVQPTENHRTRINKYLPAIRESYEQYGKQGYRVIALAHKKLKMEDKITKDKEREMIFTGFIVLEDPIKAGIIPTLQALKKLQVDLKIISGDNKNVAISIGQQLGIVHPQVLTGQEINRLSPEALKQRVPKVHIFSEVDPQQKESIVRVLRATNTVAYLGDGINDVAAMKAADLSISVQNAVDIARETADLVLLDKKLSVVLEAIKEGRKTFANTLKYIFISTGSTLGNMVSVAAASLVLPFLPMLPKQILVTNFISDAPYLGISSDRVDYEQVRYPGHWDLKLIKRYMIVFGIHSTCFDLATFLILYFAIKAQEAVFQTAWFLESMLTELSILFIIRTKRSFYRSTPSRHILVLSIISLLITLGLPYLPLGWQLGMVPLPWSLLVIIVILVAVYFITADLLKRWFFKHWT